MSKQTSPLLAFSERLSLERPYERIRSAVSKVLTVVTRQCICLRLSQMLCDCWISFPVHYFHVRIQKPAYRFLSYYPMHQICFKHIKRVFPVFADLFRCLFQFSFWQLCAAFELAVDGSTTTLRQWSRNSSPKRILSCRSFLKSGVYLTLERLRAYVYRTMIKRIASIQEKRQPDTWHQMRLSLVRTALKWLGDEMDDDEVRLLFSPMGSVLSSRIVQVSEAAKEFQRIGCNE